MASGGSSSRPPSISRSFDFGSDDVLCSYDDLGSQDSNGKRAESAGKDFRESRMGRPLVDVYNQQEEIGNRELISAVEKCMKKYADNLLRSLEGISGRLSQLELYCYNVERSIGELRSDLGRDQNESDLKLKALEKHVQEVHRSVQILRDKQELAETQKELAKLQLAQKESSEGAAPAAAAAAAAGEPRNHVVDSQDSSNQQHLALVPQQATPAYTPPVRIPEQSMPYKELPLHHAVVPSAVGLQQDPYAQTQGGGAFYVPRSQNQMQLQPQQPHPQTTAAATLQAEQQQYVAQRPQPPPQDLSRQPQPQQQLQQHPPLPPQYEQPWGQQLAAAPQQFSQQQVIQPQHVPPRGQIRPEASSSPPAFSPPYQSPNQPGSALPEIYPSSAPMQATYALLPQPGINRQPAEPFGYGGPGSTAAQLPPVPPSLQQRQQLPPLPPPPGQSSFPPQVNKAAGYPGGMPYPQQQSSGVQGYATHGGDHPGRPVQPPPHFLQGPYPPAGVPPSGQSQPPPMMRSHHHPYAELVEKAGSMGYARDHVVGAIRRLEDGGQPVDFNSVLDVLNARPAGPAQRGWSG